MIGFYIVFFFHFLVSEISELSQQRIMSIFGNEPTTLDLRIQNKLDEATLVRNKKLNEKAKIKTYSNLT